VRIGNEAEAVWERLRGTRWDAPAVAAADQMRRRTHVFALEQAEQMFRTAAEVDVETLRSGPERNRSRWARNPATRRQVTSRTVTHIMDSRRPMPLASPPGTLPHLAPPCRLSRPIFILWTRRVIHSSPSSRRPAMPDPPRTLAA
jgi:hypothetical protein